MFDFNQDVALVTNFLSKDKTDLLFHELLNFVNWQDTLISIKEGTPVRIKRKMSYVYRNISDYQYANLALKTETYENKPFLTITQNELNSKLGLKFNSVLLNMYENGKDRK